MSKNKKVHKREKTPKKYSEEELRLKSGKKILFEPCMYCDSKPLYLGNVVFLKSNILVNNKYVPKLDKLVENNHRFVLVNHRGLKKDSILVCLLSTSSFLNQEMQLGIKLSGKYNDYKDVYMDAKNYWVITKDCVKSLAYTLNEDDMYRCITNAVFATSGKLLIRNGFVDTNLINSDEFEAYQDFVDNACQISDTKFNLSVEMLKEYVNKLSKEEILEYFKSQPKEFIEDIEAIIIAHIITSNVEITDRLMVMRWTMAVVLHITGDKHSVITKLQRGY